MRACVTLALAIAMVAGARSVSAQQDRAALIAEARIESDYTAALTIYAAAAEPVGLDSLWAVSVFEIAQILRDRGEVAASDSWLRWAARHGAAWPIDPDWFAPSLVTASRQAVAEVAADGGGGADAAETAWGWPVGFPVDGTGTVVVVATDPAVGVEVTVDGQASTVDGAGPLALPVGLHELLVSAEGYAPVRVRREVLPGVAMSLTVELLPLLSADVAARVADRALRIQFVLDGTLVCTNAVPLSDGLVVSALSVVGGASRMDVLSSDRTFENVEILGRDEVADLAILGLRGTPLPGTLALSATPSTFGWSVYRESCGSDATSVRARVMGPTQQDLPRLSNGPLFPRTAAGSPVIDTDGGLVGLVVGDGRVASMEAAEDLRESATARLEEGGFPMVWLTVGVAAAAGAAVYLLKGGSSTPPQTTGSIVITLPPG